MNPLVRLIPPFLVRSFASRYVAGDSLDKALDVAATLWRERGLYTTLDLLAEGIDTPEVARHNVDTYLRMIDTVAKDERFDVDQARPTISLKLSSYTTDPLDKGGCAAGSRDAALRIAEHARERGTRLTIDMEDRHWTDFTLELIADLHRAGHTHVGAAIQTRLNRSQADLDRLPEACRVRLIIGIYNEPSDVATTDKTEMKERLLAFAGRLLGRGHYVELGTHDATYINRFVEEVVPEVGVGPDRFEIQMLYGVPRDPLLAQLREAGITARLYVPFAVGWPMAISYLRRRLDEYPAMMFLVAKNLFTGE